MRLVLVMGIGGCALIWFGIEEPKLSSIARAEATPITCAELVANGPGDNAHVLLGDFLFVQPHYVYEEGKRGWEKAWLPAVPLGGEHHQEVQRIIEEEGEDAEFPLPRKIGLIVKLTDAKNEDDVTRIGDQDTIQGLIVNDIESLGSEEKAILGGSYPGINFATCWILEVGRRPKGTGEIVGFFVGGIGLIGLAGFLVLRRRRSAGTTVPEEAAA